VSAVNVVADATHVRAPAHALRTDRTNGSYVDITGEIEVFEATWSRQDEIRSARFTVLPGAAFDVVQTNCLARYVVTDRMGPPRS
jgi:short subunit dehydrogenase-like uncharacterized protein